METKNTSNIKTGPETNTAANELLEAQLLERKQVERELRARVRQQAAVAEMGQRALVGTNLSILMEEAVLLVAQTLNMEYVTVFELLPDGNSLLLKEGVGWKEGFVGDTVIDIEDDSQFGYSLHTDGPIILENIVRDTKFNGTSLLHKHNVTSGMSVVVRGREQIFGVLGAYTTQPRTFTEDDVYFLQSVANVLAMAIERRQTEVEIIQRNRELLILQSAGAAITSSLDFQYILNTVAEQMTKLLGVEACAISDWNEKDDTITVLVEYGPDDWFDRFPEIGIYHLAEFPLTKQVLTEQRAMQMTIDQTDIDPAEHDYMQECEITAQLLVPMIYQGRAIGLVDIMDSRIKRAFADQEIELAKLLSNQAASAIENARLHAETRRMLKEQHAIREAGSTISSTLDFETVLNHIAEQMGQALDVTSAYICDLNAGSMYSTVLAEYISPYACTQEQVSNLGTTYNILQDFTSSVEWLQAGQPEFIHVDDPKLVKAERTLMQQFGVQTTLIIPMQVGGQVIGYANLQESRRQRAFSSEEITLGQDIAQQAAIAIENARLFEKTEQALEETEILYRIARSLAQIDNEQEMFDLVLMEYLQSLKLRQGGVLLIDEDKDFGTLKAHMVDGQLVEPGLRIPIAGNSSYSRLIENREPVVINDTSEDELLKSAKELTLDLGIKSMLLVPIVSRGEVIGALGADSTQTIHTFTGRKIELGRAMANQLSIAIENVRLQAETEERAEQLAVLHELDRAITTSLRLSDIYFAFARHVNRLLPYDRMSITQGDDNTMRIAYVVDETKGEDFLPVDTILPRQTSAAGWVMNHRQPLVRHNIAADNRFVEDEQLVGNDIQASMIIPLRIKGEVMGTWHIDSRQVGAYSPNDLKTAQAMADQLAIAIENARLYTEIQQYLEELTTLNMISQTITSTLNLEEMLSIITQHTVQLAGVAAASVVLYDESREKLRFAASSGMYGDAVRGVELEPGQGIVGWVVENQEPILIPDVSKDSRFFDKFDKTSGFTTESVLCVPLQTKGHTIGAIEAMNKANGPFDQEDLRLLISLAAPAATAIETAHLFELAQQELAERKRAEAALEEERALLARRVEERTTDLRAANEELARASRLKDEFLASMSHELRTPLTAILGLSEVLRAEVYGALTDKQVKSIQDIEDSGRHLLALINDILDLSKVEAGQLELQIGPVAVESVCQSSMQFIKQTAHKKHLKVSFTLDSQVSIVQADERRLKQILVNLLSNAVKFTPENGTVGLEVAGDTQQNLAHFTVWDTGIGISQEDIKRLFQPFVQLDSSLSRQHAGTGLGLALVSRMIDLHNGTIALESEVGQGSRFTISLPWGDPTHLVGQRDQQPDVLSDETSPLVIKTALIIDDSPTTAETLTRYLRKLGITTAVHPQGTGAVEKVIEYAPDVIILDIILSDASGWDILAELKAETLTQNIPVLVVSAMDGRKRGLDLGAAEYLVKPIEQEELHHVLSQLVLPTASNGKQHPSIRNEEKDKPWPDELPLILVAEDEGHIVTLLTDYLRAKNFRVTVARNGIQAIEKAETEAPGIILMDVQMPEMDGLEAIRHLRNTSKINTPIIALTALAMSGDRERCLEAGANDYISKPVNLKHLVKTINSQLAQHANQKAEG